LQEKKSRSKRERTALAVQPTPGIPQQQHLQSLQDEKSAIERKQGDSIDDDTQGGHAENKRKRSDDAADDTQGDNPWSGTDYPPFAVRRQIPDEQLKERGWLQQKKARPLKAGTPEGSKEKYDNFWAHPSHPGRTFRSKHDVQRFLEPASVHGAAVAATVSEVASVHGAAVAATVSEVASVHGAAVAATVSEVASVHGAAVAATVSEVRPASQNAMQLEAAGPAPLVAEMSAVQESPLCVLVNPNATQITGNEFSHD